MPSWLSRALYESNQEPRLQPTLLTLCCSKVTHGSPVPSPRISRSSARHSPRGPWKPPPPVSLPSFPPSWATGALASSHQLFLGLPFSFTPRSGLMLVRLLHIPERTFTHALSIEFSSPFSEQRLPRSSPWLPTAHSGPFALPLPQANHGPGQISF